MAYALLSYKCYNMMHCPGKVRCSCIAATDFSLVFRLMVTAKQERAFSILKPNSADGKRSQRDKEREWRLLASIIYSLSVLLGRKERSSSTAQPGAIVMRFGGERLRKRKGSIARALVVALSLIASKRTPNLSSHRCHPTNVSNFWSTQPWRDHRLTAATTEYFLTHQSTHHNKYKQ